MKYTFPDHFLWGSAFSGPQTESAELADNKTPSIWLHTFKEDKYKFFNQMYCVNDFYHNYKTDIAHAKKLNFNSLRTSIQWSRLIPDGKNVDQKAVEFYKNVFTEMLNNKITPIVNLFHFDMPMWAQEMGGWLNRDVVNSFAEYAKKCFELFGKIVKHWTTFNEPIVVAECGYLFQYHYPFEVDMKKYCQVQWNTLVAHLKIAQIFKNQKIDGKLGIILNITPAIPRSQNVADLTAAKIADAFQSKCYLDAIVKHEYPEIILKLARKHHFTWDILPEDWELISDKTLTVDFLGVNYYAPNRVKCVDSVPNFEYGAITVHYFYESYTMPGRRFNPYRGWEIFPKGLYLCLKDIQENYDNIPVYVSENGMGVENEQRFRDDQGMIDDQYRIDFIQEHLAWISKAISEGANCFGYHMWTYIDNWSWLNAYKNRYGFIELDLDNDNYRRWKKSAYWFQQVPVENSIEFAEII